MYERVKRLVDVVGATVLLVAASPVLLLAAVLVRSTMGWPVLYRQIRSGRGGRPFTLLKFRTMRHPGPRETTTASDADRVTPIGGWLRKTSMDELPQLLNVLRGEMSLVGPRPLLPQYLPRYSPEQARRHEVRPGVTGLVQVRGRNALSWKDRLALDVWYVDHRSAALDLSIIWRTGRAVLSGRGARDSHITSAEFVGSGPTESASRSQGTGTRRH
jgi:lipopolysaccharide/colanic/teichoic acid biosynthesis glycosyltransferase